MAVVAEFVDAINHGDVARLAGLMADDHELIVFAEPPLRGREANVAAWLGYATSFPDYVISPHHLVVNGGRVAIVGHTTGSHLALPDDEEAKLTLIWIAEVEGRFVKSWRLLEDAPNHRARLGLDAVEAERS